MLCFFISCCYCISIDDVKKSFQGPVSTTHDQLLNHFDFTSNTTFVQRVYLNGQYCKTCTTGNVNILFYAGAEAATEIVTVTPNATVMSYYAQKLGLYMMAAEHRFYGQSSPFPNKTHTGRFEEPQRRSSSRRLQRCCEHRHKDVREDGIHQRQCLQHWRFVRRPSELGPT